MDGERQSATAGDPPSFKNYDEASCGPVYVELLTFDLPAPRLRQAGDPESRLPAIDRLEGFHPGGRSLYKRILVPVIYRAGDRFGSVGVYWRI